MMERTHYRRRTSSRNMGSHRQPETKASMRETLLRQCIVCGIILAVVMAFSLINVPFTQNIRKDLKNAITQNTSPEEMKHTAGSAATAFNEMEHSVKTILGQTPEGDAAPTAPPASEPAAQPAVNSSAAPTEEASPVPTESITPDRIDEDILKQINDKAAAEEAKKKQKSAVTEAPPAQ